MIFLDGSILLDIFILITLVLGSIYAFFKWSHTYWRRRKVPYLEPSFPFGNMPNRFLTNLDPGTRVLQLYKEAKAKGLKYCGVYRLSRPAIIIADLDLLKHVMTKDFQSFVNRGRYTNDQADPIGSHLFNLGGTKWRNLRTKLTPTFTSGKMKSMFQTVADVGVILEKFMDQVDCNEPLDIKDVLGRYATDVIGTCAFGLDCNSFKNPNSPFRVYGKKFFDRTKLEAIKLDFADNYPTIAKALGIKVVESDVSRFYNEIVKDTISYREKNGVSRNDFMQLLIGMKNGNAAGDGKTMTMDEIVAQSFVFFLAGFETSSTTMTFALYELATHPEIQDKVRDEINTVLAKHKNKITYDSMNELVYMKQVIDETLRKYPPVALLTRECTSEYQIPGSNLVLEKGTVIYIAVKGIQSDPEYYENPEDFDPERFNEENKNVRHPYAHIPFGEGPRVCIGERFGIMQTKVGLTSVLRNHKITLNKRTPYPFVMHANSPVMSVQGGIWLNIHRL